MLLCNYVDVYKNDFIRPGMGFMEATATLNQVSTFTLRAGDVLITKDSEEWNDIAVPAFVEAGLEGVLCGYHLALIRPDAAVSDGRYLFRAFAAEGIADQFRVAANGITRYGLGGQDIADAVFPVPPMPEQRSIAAFLDRKTAAIDALIAKKQRMIELLHEKRQALISQAVTKGLDPNVKMKDSGIEWVGRIPQNWLVKKLKYITRQIIDGTHLTPTYVADGIPFLRVTDIHGDKIDWEEVKRIPLAEHMELSRRCRPQRGDLLLSKNGTIGVPFVVNFDDEFSIFVSLCLIKPRLGLLPEYAKYVFLSNEIKEQIAFGGKTNTITNLHLNKIREFVFAVPPHCQQTEIVKAINCISSQINKTIMATEEQNAKLREYRQAIIAAAVTGQIDVREAMSA